MRMGFPSPARERRTERRPQRGTRSKTLTHRQLATVLSFDFFVGRRFGRRRRARGPGAERGLVRDDTLVAFNRRFFHGDSRIVILRFRDGEVDIARGKAPLHREPLQTDRRVLFNRTGVCLLFDDTYIRQEL